MSSKHESPGGDEIPPITKEIAKKLGDIGVDYGNLPRRTKKAVKKAKVGKALTSLELARLQALRSRQQKE
jgi:hypothetical protein